VEKDNLAGTKLQDMDAQSGRLIRMMN